MKLVFLTGLPKAGKTVTSYSVKQMLSSLRKTVFLERLSPDCEGDWTIESPCGAEMARLLKSKLKQAGKFWGPEFCQHAIRTAGGLAKNPAFEVVLLDLGGVPSPENREIICAAMAQGNREIVAVILRSCATEPSTTEPWERFWNDLGITPAQIETKYVLCAGISPDAFEAERKRVAREILKLLGYPTPPLQETPS